MWAMPQSPQARCRAERRMGNRLGPGPAGLSGAPPCGDSASAELSVH